MRRGKTRGNEFLARQNKGKWNLNIFFFQGKDLHSIGRAGREPGLQNGRIINFQRFRYQGSFIGRTSTVLTQEQHGKQTAFTGFSFLSGILGFIQKGQKGRNLQQRSGRIHIR